MTRKRWLVAAVLAAWAATLVGAGVWSAHTGPATVREQSPLAQGRQTVEAAAARLVAAAGPGVASEVGELQLTSGCQLTLVREGAAADQVILLAVPEGQEPALLEKLAARLPERWQARHFSGSGRLVADAGDFVSVVGEVTGPGQVQVTLSTGCRPD